MQEVLAYISAHAQQNVTLDNVWDIYDTLFCEVFIGIFVLINMPNYDVLFDLCLFNGQ